MTVSVYRQKIKFLKSILKEAVQNLRAEELAIQEFLLQSRMLGLAKFIVNYQVLQNEEKTVPQPTGTAEWNIHYRILGLIEPGLYFLLKSTWDMIEVWIGGRRWGFNHGVHLRDMWISNYSMPDASVSSFLN